MIFGKKPWSSGYWKLERQNVSSSSAFYNTEVRVFEFESPRYKIVRLMQRLLWRQRLLLRGNPRNIGH